MVGICGILGSGGTIFEEVTEATRWSGREQRNDFTDENLSIAAQTFLDVETEQPATVPDSRALVWCYGSLFGVETPYGYEPRTDTDPDHVYCASLFDQYGIDFASRVNGTFAAVIYEPDEGVVHFVTDRLGTHPLFFTRTTDGELAFSSHVQSLVHHPDVDTSFHPEYLAEYCTLGRVGGIYTPYRGVTQFQPGAVTSVDLDTLELETRHYWKPVYQPVSKPFDHYVDRFTKLLKQVVDERFSPRKRPGLLLSGGSDSRLLLSRAPRDTIGYHLSDWMSREARTAERVALETGIEFRWLRRDDDYQETVLERVAPTMNFTGRFEQAHVGGYVDKLTDEVDVLVSGLFADTLFRGLTVPKRTFDLGSLGHLTVPVESVPSTADEYLDLYPSETASYLTGTAPLREILRKNLTVHRDGRIVDHGVEYESIRELVMYNSLYPLTGDADLFYWSLEQTMPHWTPFLDNRMIDLALQFPMEYQLRRNISNAALTRLCPCLASLPNATSRVPPSMPFPVEYLGTNLTALKRRFISEDTPPQPYFKHHPWTYYPELLRHHRFPQDRLASNRDVVQSLPDIDWMRARRALDEHTGDAQNAFELYTLLSLLEMPATARIAADAESPSDPLESEAHR